MWFVGVGGFFGAITRFLVGKWISGKVSNPSFFYGTWIINLTGSFLLGFTAVLHGNDSLPNWAWLTLGTGFLGAYTTFSTFGYETIQLLEKRKAISALVYVSSSIFCGLILAWIGQRVAIGLN